MSKHGKKIDAWCDSCNKACVVSLNGNTSKCPHCGSPGLHLKK